MLSVRGERRRRSPAWGAGAGYSAAVMLPALAIDAKRGIAGRYTPPTMLGLVYILSLQALTASSAPVDTTRAEEPPARIELMPPRLRAGAFIYLPKLYYSSETSVGIGGDLLLPFGAGVRRGEIHVKGRATFKGQGEVQLAATIGPEESAYAFKASLTFSSLPLHYYGIGPKTPDSAEEIYEPQAIGAYVEFFRRVVPHVKLGLRAETEQHRLVDLDPEGQLVKRTVRGTRGRVIAGGGVVFELDTRDRAYTPESGWYVQGFALVFDDEMGSEHDFNNSHVDARRFDSIGGGTVLATQLFWYSVRGPAPFWRYAALGGRAHTRGYRRARYIDRELLAAQLELRIPIWRRASGVAFCGLADVASHLDELRVEAARPTVGAGLRFRVKKVEGLNVRLDAAVGGSFDRPRLYLGLGEAF